MLYVNVNLGLYMDENQDDKPERWDAGEWTQREAEWLKASRAMLAALPDDFDDHAMETHLREAEKNFRALVAFRRAAFNDRSRGSGGR